MKSVFDNLMESILVAIVVMSLVAGGKAIKSIPAMETALSHAANK
jgi:hypothetical protein